MEKEEKEGEEPGCFKQHVQNQMEKMEKWCEGSFLHVLVMKKKATTNKKKKKKLMTTTTKKKKKKEKKAPCLLIVIL